jgi:hypothetical protein
VQKGTSALRSDARHSSQIYLADHDSNLSLAPYTPCDHYTQPPHTSTNSGAISARFQCEENHSIHAGFWTIRCVRVRDVGHSWRPNSGFFYPRHPLMARKQDIARIAASINPHD